jgi:hypothetical protein
MRPFLITAGLLGILLASIALAGDGPESATTTPDLSARIDALTKELEALKPLPMQVTELQEEIRELKLQIAVLSARPVVAPAPPSNLPRGAVGYEFNGSTVYMIPLGGLSLPKARPATTKLP